MTADRQSVGFISEADVRGRGPSTSENVLDPVLPSVAVRAEPPGLCVCMLSGVEPGQLVEGPGASLISEVEA